MSVVVIGDVILDVNYIGNSHRLAQEACIPIVNVDEQKITYTLGGAANVFRNLVNLDVNTSFISVIGTGNYEEIVKSEFMNLNESKITLFSDKTRCITSKHRFYVNNKIVFRYDIENTHDISLDHETNIIKKFNTLKDVSILILSDYNKGTLTTYLTQELIKIANSKNIKVFVDPKTKNFQKYKNAYLIKPNKTECEIICNKRVDSTNETELQSVTNEIINKSNCQICLLTLGEFGISMRNNDDFMIINNEKKKSVVDITGAGDVVLASFTYGYLKFNDLKLATQLANYCGRIKVSNFGTYTLSPYDILMFTIKYKSKEIKNENISETINTIKNAGKKIVFTNGCFDILHYGHLAFLKDAKNYGDILIVALNTDESVKTNKGDSRPINNLNKRIKQMEAINYVDFIMTFNEKTPLELIKIIQPDVLIKGGDYKIESVVGRDYAKETIILSYNEGFSTTNIIKMINK